MLGRIEILLKQRVRREARPAGERAGIQAGADALDMHGRSVVVLPGAVRDRVAAALDLVGALVESKLVAEYIQQWQHPTLAGYRCARIALAQIFDIGLEQHPMAARCLPGRRNPVAEVAA